MIKFTKNEGIATFFPKKATEQSISCHWTESESHGRISAGSIRGGNYFVKVFCLNADRASATLTVLALIA